MLIMAVSEWGGGRVLILMPIFRVLWWAEGGASNSELLEGRVV